MGPWSRGWVRKSFLRYIKAVYSCAEAFVTRLGSRGMLRTADDLD